MKKLTEEQENLLINIEYLMDRNESDEIYEEILVQEIDNEYIPHKRFPTLLAALIKKGYIAKRVEADYGGGKASIICRGEYVDKYIAKIKTELGKN
jgi:hypothetical protein